MLNESSRDSKRKKMEGILTTRSMAVLLLLASAIVAANLPLQAVYADGSFFKNPKNISKTNLDSVFQGVRGANIETSGKHVYVTWVEDPAAATRQVYFTRSTDGGNTFEIPESISGNIAAAEDPEIAAYGKNVYVVFEGQNAAGDMEIFLARSTDRGDDFDRPKNISNQPGASELPNIDVFKDNVFVVWEQDVPQQANTFDIFVTGSDNGGDDFDEPKPKNISNDPVDSRNAQVSVSGDTAYVVWQEDPPAEIFFNRGKD